MMFKTETDLVNLLRVNLEEKYQNKKVEIFQEVSLGFGIADMVVSVVKETELEPEQKSGPGQSEMSEMEIHIYGLLENDGPIPFSEIQEYTRIERYQLHRYLSRLKERGFVEQENESYQICRNFDLVFKSNYAIEAKLKNWNRALKQAYRYRWFAEYSYVVMDAHYSAPAIAHIELFRKYNVGLATIDVSGKMERYFHPMRKVPFDLRMQRLLSERIRCELPYST